MKSVGDVDIEENYLYSDKTRVVHIPFDEEIATMTSEELRHNVKDLYLENEEIRSEKALGSGNSSSNMDVYCIMQLFIKT